MQIIKLNYDTKKEKIYIKIIENYKSDDIYK